MTTSIDFGPLSGGAPPSDAYTPAVAANWLSVPTTQSGALDWFAGVLNGNSLHVDPAIGDDTKSGSLLAPLDTVQAAVNAVDAATGSEYYINLDNQINEFVVVNDTPASAKRILIQGRDRETTRWTSGGTNILAVNGNANLATKVSRINSDKSITASGVGEFVLEDAALGGFGDIELTSCPDVLIQDCIIENDDFTLTNCAAVRIGNSSIAVASGSVALFQSTDGTNMSIDVSGRNADKIAGQGVFTGLLDLFLVVGAGSINFRASGETIGNGLFALTIPSGVTVTLDNCHVTASSISISAGGTLVTSRGCRLPAIANAGTWTDYGSTVASVSGDGTTTYNGTVIATPGALTASRTQFRTDRNLNADATAGSITYQLLPLASVPLEHPVRLTRAPGGALNTVTITPDGVETIDGLASIALAEYQTVNLVRKSTFWSAQ